MTWRWYESELIVGWETRCNYDAIRNMACEWMHFHYVRLSVSFINEHCWFVSLGHETNCHQLLIKHLIHLCRTIRTTFRRLSRVFLVDSVRIFRGNWDVIRCCWIAMFLSCQTMAKFKALKFIFMTIPIQIRFTVRGIKTLTEFSASVQRSWGFPTRFRQLMRVAWSHQELTEVGNCFKPSTMDQRVRNLSNTLETRKASETWMKIVFTSTSSHQT